MPTCQILVLCTGMLILYIQRPCHAHCQLGNSDSCLRVKSTVLTSDKSALIMHLDTFYILEVKLKYPVSLHAAHSDYPLCPEHLKITKDMLSPYSLLNGEKHITCEKLTPTLHDKDHYVLHYENFKQCLELGMELAATYRILEFEQSTWLRKYIEFNVERRKNASTKFEQDLMKL